MKPILASTPEGENRRFFRGDMQPTDTSQPDYFHKVVDCQWACPAHTDVPEYIRLIAQGRFTDAYMVNRHSNVFPGILGRVCDRPCEPACRRGRVEEKPVAICRLKRVAADNKDDITGRLPKGFAAFMPFYASGCSKERLEKARTFFADPKHQVPGQELQLSEVADQVEDCVGLREREGEAMVSYLEKSTGGKGGRSSASPRIGTGAPAWRARHPSVSARTA